MKTLLYLREINTFNEDGTIPNQLWGDEIQAKWFKKALVKKGFDVDIKGSNEIPKDKYDLVVYFHTNLPKAQAKKHILWLQSAEGFENSIGKFDGYLMAFYNIYEKYKDKLKIIYFPAGIDLEERYFVKNTEYKSDIVFIGNFLVRTSDCYERYLDPVVELGLDLKIYGNGGKQWQFSKYNKFYQGHLNVFKTNEVISGSKIFLCIHTNMHRIEGMFSGNVLNGLACETLVVSDRVSSLEKFLGECILLVDGGKDSKEKISEILSNDKKRKEMIEIGKEKIKEFTFDRRVEDLVKFI